MSDSKHLKETLQRLHSELCEVQAAHHDQLKAASKFPYPLNPCIFELANIMCKLNEKESFLKITETSSEHGKRVHTKNLQAGQDAGNALNALRELHAQAGYKIKETGAGFIAHQETYDTVEFKIEFQGARING